MATEALEIEVDSQNANIAFAPLSGRRVRGAFNARNIKELEGQKLLSAWPDTVPGTRIGFDVATGVGYLYEPLYEPKHRPTKGRIEKAGYQLPPEREEFKGAHAPTWLYWMKRCVESGHAKVISGSLPAKIEGEPITEFITKRTKTPTENLIAATQKQTEAFERVAVALEKLVGALASGKK